MAKIIKPSSKNISRINIEKRLEYSSTFLEIESIALSDRFYKRPPKKITATDFVHSFWMMQQNAKNSLDNWAMHMGKLSNQCVTKQAIAERLTSDTVNFAKALLRHALNLADSKNTQVLKKQSKKTKKHLKSILQHFNRVIIHDSTTQRVPQSLVNHFPGNRSNGEIKAVMRIQAVYNFTEENWLDLSVGAYNENDQSNASALIEKLEKKDLLIRDLGYFVLDAIDQLTENQYLITKWDHRTSLFTDDGYPLDLITTLKQNKELDQPVLVGSKHKIKMRLIARKLPKKQAEARIAQAKKDRNIKTNHSEAYYELLQYEIYLTNIPPQILDISQIAKMYGLRWYIEILFKSWKSYFNFKKMLGKNQMTYHRTLVSIYLILVQFVYLTSQIFDYVKSKIENAQESIYISILKFMNVTNTFLSDILKIEKLDDLNNLIPQFKKHSIYEIRKDRKNMKEKFQYFKELTY